MSDSSDLDAMILTVLSADAALMAIATNGVWFDVAPPASTRFVIVTLQTETDETEFTDTAWEHAQYLIKATLLNGSGADIKVAAQRIHVVIQGLEARIDPATLPGYRLMRAQRVERVRYLEVDPEAPDLRWQHRGGMYEFFAQPT